MRFTRQSKRRRTPTVIIVSLIDVLLVVLIFLMISTTLKSDPPAVKLSLPESSQAKPGATESKPIVISISSNAPYFFLAERPVTFDHLQKELVAAAQRDPQVRVAIKADKQAPWGEFVKVWDAAKAANVAGINAITERPAVR
jgi:biopolymer transport protein ExbD